MQCCPDSTALDITAENTVCTHYTYNDDGMYLYRSKTGLEKS